MHKCPRCGIDIIPAWKMCERCAKEYRKQYQQTKSYKEYQKAYRKTQAFKDSVKKYKKSLKAKIRKVERYLRNKNHSKGD